jgi:hypothetical protein
MGVMVVRKNDSRVREVVRRARASAGVSTDVEAFVVLEHGTVMINMHDTMELPDQAQKAIKDAVAKLVEHKYTVSLT